MDLLQYCYRNICSSYKAILLFDYDGSTVGICTDGLYVLWRWKMKAIACAIISLVLFYMENKIKSTEIKLRASYLISSHIFLIGAIILMILGR